MFVIKIITNKPKIKSANNDHLDMWLGFQYEVERMCLGQELVEKNYTRRMTLYDTFILVISSKVSLSANLTKLILKPVY